ncbi:protein-tyrosine phosphatase family protein [Acinetobacter larvae]|uniref:Uncharacterized protein n=1 Tax=Acinetobacter larvae TaxID=1789224 RepID=A0A1B2LZR3_9GAMM|nr:hypothetical protein [Acinetobacter larvae]AOA58436.1 hypothetical protein BFG52_08775 [Acinetobacter larvae]
MCDDLEQQLCQCPDFQYIHQHLFSSKQLPTSAWALLKAYGIDSVIDIDFATASTTSKTACDRDCVDAGLKYIHIPLDLSQPADEQCLLILDLIDYISREKMLWLQGNTQIVSCLLYLYRLHYLQFDIAEADACLQQHWQPDATWTGLMHVIGLQLQGRKATQELQQTLAQVEQAHDA